MQKQFNALANSNKRNTRELADITNTLPTKSGSGTRGKRKRKGKSSGRSGRKKKNKQSESDVDEEGKGTAEMKLKIYTKGREFAVQHAFWVNISILADTKISSSYKPEKRFTSSKHGLQGTLLEILDMLPEEIQKECKAKKKIPMWVLHTVSYSPTLLC